MECIKAGVFVGGDVCLFTSRVCMDARRNKSKMVKLPRHECGAPFQTKPKIPDQRRPDLASSACSVNELNPPFLRAAEGDLNAAEHIRQIYFSLSVRRLSFSASAETL